MIPALTISPAPPIFWIISGTTLPSGSLEMQALAYDIYLDGASEVTGINNMTNNATEDLIIGDGDDIHWEECQGDVGSVMVHNRSLSPDEIKQNCNAQEGRYTASDDICEDF